MGTSLSRLSWDDLRIVRAIGERRTIALAAAILGMDTSTLFRRLARVEEALGVALFDRRRSGYVATSAGAEVIALAQRLELEIVSVVQRVSEDEQGLAGDLRLTTSDSLALYLLTPIIADFRAQHPAIRVELIVGNTLLNLARGEADVALRATETPPGNLYGRKLATIAWAAYGRRADFPQGSAAANELDRRPWVSYTGALSGLKACKLVEAHVPRTDVAYRTDSVAGVAAAIAAGLGVGYLPCMLGDLDRELVRLGGPERSLADELWLLTHPDIRKSRRVGAFMAHCADAVAKQRALIEGDARSVSDRQV